MNRDDVDLFKESTLDALQLIACTADDQSEGHIDHVGNNQLALSDSHRFDEHHFVARCFAQQQRLASFGGDTTQRAARRRRADERVGMSTEFHHTRLVTENAPPTDG